MDEIVQAEKFQFLTNFRSKTLGNTGHFYLILRSLKCEFIICNVTKWVYNTFRRI